MKKNLAKKIVLGLLTGAVLMSSSVAWAAGFIAVDKNEDNGASRALGEWSVTVGYGNAADGVGCADCMKAGENQMSGLSRGHGGLNGLMVTHLTQ